MPTSSILKPFCILLACIFSIQVAKAQLSFTNNNIYANKTSDMFLLHAAPQGGDGPYIEMFNNTSSDASRAGSIGYVAGRNSANPSGISHTFFSRTAGNGWTSHMRILQDGKVQIGQQVPSTAQTDYRLSVDGKLVAKSLYVTTPSTWADFVFAPTYERMSLTELETYLQLNRHLPTMPSASEVEAKGYNVSEMDAKLLQTVEELTLHIIELSKQNQQLQTRTAELERQLKVEKVNR